MINAFLIFNNAGQPRLTKFFTQIETAARQKLISEIFTLVNNRPASACNFLPLPPLLAKSSRTGDNDDPSKVVYRHYATLYFIVIATDTESDLALLDMIQAFVEALDKLFENVCELDLIFNYETLDAALAEMILGGIVVETDSRAIVEGVKLQGKVPKRQADNRGGLGLGSGVWAGSWFGGTSSSTNTNKETNDEANEEETSFLGQVQAHQAEGSQYGAIQTNSSQAESSQANSQAQNAQMQNTQMQNTAGLDIASQVATVRAVLEVEDGEGLFMML